MNNDRLFWIVMGVIGAATLILVFNHDSGTSFGVSNDNFADMVWLGMIGLVISAGIFSRGMPVGHMLRQMAIWLMIFLALMVGYQVFNQTPSAPPSGSGTGISASLMDGVDRILHL